jgi:hypothetical protein
MARLNFFRQTLLFGGVQFLPITERVRKIMSGFEGIRRTVPPPPGSAELQQKINEVVAELRSRGLHDDRCPRCRTTNWSVDFFQLPIAPIGAGGYSPGPLLNAFVPVASFTCMNCGNTINHNLKILGKDK